MPIIVGTKSPAHAKDRVQLSDIGPPKMVTWTVCFEPLRIRTRRDPHLMGSMPYLCLKVISKFHRLLRDPAQQGCLPRVGLGLLLALCIDLEPKLILKS